MKFSSNKFCWTFLAHNVWRNFHFLKYFIPNDLRAARFGRSPGNHRRPLDRRHTKTAGVNKLLYHLRGSIVQERRRNYFFQIRFFKVQLIFIIKIQNCKKASLKGWRLKRDFAVILLSSSVMPFWAASVDVYGPFHEERQQEGIPWEPRHALEWF